MPVTRLLNSLLLVCCLSGCDVLSSVPAGRIQIKNNFWGKKNSSFTVSGGGMTRRLNAHEEILMPTGTTSMSFSYQGQDGPYQYKVQCPPRISKGITLKLIDVHSNRLPGGCETVWSSRKNKF